MLERFDAEVEYVPALVSYKRNTRDDYFVTNPLCRIRGVDMNASKLELDDAGIALAVDELVLNESLFAGVPLAVVHETLHLAVQPNLAEGIRKEIARDVHSFFRRMFTFSA